MEPQNDEGGRREVFISLVLVLVKCFGNSDEHELSPDMLLDSDRHISLVSLSY